MGKISVMVTGVGGGGVGAQIMKCLRMSSLDYSLVACDMDRKSMGLAMADKAYLVPSAAQPDYLESILEICRKNNVQALFPGSEPELKVMSASRKIFEANGIYVPLNPESVIHICMDKYLTMSFLRENGFAVQKYWEIQDPKDLEEVDLFPVVLKPSVGGGGSVNAFIAQDRDELHLFGRYLLKLYKRFLVQEYVGNMYSEYTVGVIHGANGEYINAIAVKKNIQSGLSTKIRVPNRTKRNELGDTLVISNGVSQGEIGRFCEVIDSSREIAQRLGCTAAINIQCRLHQGKMYVFEINPRISGTSSLRAMVGYNEPDILVREKILGEKVEVDFAYRTGYIARGLSEQYISQEFQDAIEQMG